LTRSRTEAEIEPVSSNWSTLLWSRVARTAESCNSNGFIKEYWYKEQKSSILKQCSGSGSESGSAFWLQIWIQILSMLSYNIHKILSTKNYLNPKIKI